MKMQLYSIIAIIINPKWPPNKMASYTFLNNPPNVSNERETDFQSSTLVQDGNQGLMMGLEDGHRNSVTKRHYLSSLETFDSP